MSPASAPHPATAGALRFSAVLALAAVLAASGSACVELQCSSAEDCGPHQDCVSSFCEPHVDVCGDGIVTPPELCDLGPENGPSSHGCTDLCEPPRCGDGRQEVDVEECDGGALNGPDGECTEECHVQPPVCGNAVLEAGEDCDEGSAQNQDVFGPCTAACFTNQCGNATVDRGEGCEEGIADDDHSASCTLSCQRPSCGDGERAPGESCDGAIGCDPATCRFGDRCAAIQIWARNNHSIVRLEDGSLVAFGDNELDAFGIGDPSPVLTRPTPIPGDELAGLCQGRSFGAGVTPDGRVLTWGDNRLGQRGVGDATQRQGRSELPLRGFVEVACGERFGVARRGDGTLWGWGDNRSGVLGTDPPGQRRTLAGFPQVDADSPYVPTPVALFDAVGGFRAIAAGKWHFVALKEDFSVWSIGGNGAGQLGDGSAAASCLLPPDLLDATPFRSELLPVAGAPKARRISAGWFTTLVLDERGRPWGWGSDCMQELNRASEVDRQLFSHPTPALLYLSDAGGLTSAKSRARELCATDGGFSLVVTRDRGLSSFGSAPFGQLCKPPGSPTLGEGRAPLPDGVLLEDARGGEYHTLLLTTDGRVLTCGNNSAGQLGNGSQDPDFWTSVHPEPFEVPLCP